ncbi:MAG: hypothetical protein F6K11_25390 [Leptolyngbya sp. SIO3F4]|nr:hypothetical protein [Leptolyngbya sp. SIO3F4]
MLDNTALIEALIGTTGIASIVGTAILARTPLLTKLGELRDLKVQVEGTVKDKLAQLDAKLAYIQGKFEVIEKVLADGIVTPAEADELRTEYQDIREQIGQIFNGVGGDAS